MTAIPEERLHDVKRSYGIRDRSAFATLIAVATNADFELDDAGEITLLRLLSGDQTNRLTRRCVIALTATVRELSLRSKPLIITGNHRFFSAGADLNEIAALSSPDAYEFAKMGQELMNAIESFPAPVCAAICGYCMGGGLDLALACNLRIAHPGALFGHRGASLGLITGWGGTQRLPRLIGQANALKMFVAAEKLTAAQALKLRLVSRLSDDPVQEAIRVLASS